MKPRLLKPEPLTPKAFAPYGDVIECSELAVQKKINYGSAVRFHDLAALDLNAGTGKPLVSIVRSIPLERPIAIKVMERHPLSSQAFYPLSGHPYIVVVAEKGDFDPRKVRAFLVSKNQGVNYHKGTWHHYLLSLDGESDFLVIDRGGPEENCDEVFLQGADSIHLEY
ncbi:MAG: ureidoglycolate lyase [Proteobacteria bacterium]|nr:ureidoglycolate lyase [Pseudomonadota bacterium]